MSGNVAFSNDPVITSKFYGYGSGGGLGLTYVTNGIVLRLADVDVMQV